MITIDNFYWVLYHNLLKPVGLDCRYFYPFGTVQNFSEFEYSSNTLIEPSRADLIPSGLRHRSHVLFHFDQEPIYPESELLIFRGTQGNHLTRTRILANSEISTIKKDFCKKYRLLDWYFFYHGFAALHWYQDLSHVEYDDGFSHPYLSFNHLVKNRRSYRMALTARLVQKNIHERGLISFHGNQNDCAQELIDVYTLLSDQDKDLIQQYLVPSQIPMQVDSASVDGNFSALMGQNEYCVRQRGLFHVVNETVFYDDKVHLTEKIFQPIVVMRPFLLVGAPGNLEYLKRYGFQTFSDWIDESYDTISDPTARLDAIADQLQHLANLPQSTLDDMFRDMQSVLHFNKRHFFTDFRKIIVHELVDNFDCCVRIWNNGRVDGRELTLHPNLELVKNTLLR